MEFPATIGGSYEAQVFQDGNSAGSYSCAVLAFSFRPSWKRGIRLHKKSKRLRCRHGMDLGESTLPPGRRREGREGANGALDYRSRQSTGSLPARLDSQFL